MSIKHISTIAISLSLIFSGANIALAESQPDFVKRQLDRFISAEPSVHKKLANEVTNEILITYKVRKDTVSPASYAINQEVNTRSTTYKVKSRETWNISDKESLIVEVWERATIVSVLETAMVLEDIQKSFRFVESAVLNTSLKSQTLMFNDPLSTNQWHLKSESLEDVKTYGQTDYTAAQTRGLTGKGVVLGIIDDGFVVHQDSGGNKLPGYGFLESQPDEQLDKRNENNIGKSCQDSERPIAWHGLQMELVARATANNGYGTAGVAPGSSYYHLRALSDCGGNILDIARAIFWAAGGDIEGYPKNNNPSQVINMSLSGFGACVGLLKEATVFAARKGSIVVSSAGNSAISGSLEIPAACPTVLGVEAHTRSGHRAFYSTVSNAAAIATPGGGAAFIDRAGQIYPVSGIQTSSNDGINSLGKDLESKVIAGTSPAAAMLSGLLTAAKELAPGLTWFEAKEALKQTAKPWPADSYCSLNPTKCGPGLAQPKQFLERITQPFDYPKSINVNLGVVDPDQPLNILAEVILDSGKSIDDVEFDWSLGEFFDGNSILSGKNSRVVTVEPSLRPGSYALSLELNYKGSSIKGKYIYAFDVAKVGKPVAKDKSIRFDANDRQRFFALDYRSGVRVKDMIFGGDIVPLNYLAEGGFVSMPQELTKPVYKMTFSVLDENNQISAPGVVTIFVDGLPDSVEEEPENSNENTEGDLDENPNSPESGEGSDPVDPLLPAPGDEEKINNPSKEPVAASSGGGGSVNLGMLPFLIGLLLAYKSKVKAKT